MQIKHLARPLSRLFGTPDDSPTAPDPGSRSIRRSACSPRRSKAARKRYARRSSSWTAKV